MPSFHLPVAVNPGNVVPRILYAKGISKELRALLPPTFSIALQWSNLLALSHRYVADLATAGALCGRCDKWGRCCMPVIKLRCKGYADVGLLKQGCKCKGLQMQKVCRGMMSTEAVSTRCIEQQHSAWETDFSRGTTWSSVSAWIRLQCKA